jgi:TusA-related sulfurtransferase
MPQRVQLGQYTQYAVQPLLRKDAGMRAEDIRKIYDQEDEADLAEAGATLRAVLTDPGTARDHIMVMAALAPTDADFAQLWRRFLQKLNLSERELGERLLDDTFALEAGKHMLALMEQMKPGSVLEPIATPPAKVQRGRQSIKKPKSA